MNNVKNLLITALIAIVLALGYLQFNREDLKPEVNVYPSSVKSLNSLELGEVILFLMPPTGMNLVDWGYLSNTKINWLDDSYKSIDTPQGVYNSRTGLVRINVMGNKSTILKKQTTELAWSVVYENYGNPKYGVEIITIKPGTEDSDGICFGSTAENCSFNPIKSFGMEKIKYRQICKSSEKVGFELSAEGKRKIKAAWITSTGSGGSSSWIELYVNSGKEDICAE
jgi:hypothetical protein